MENSRAEEIFEKVYFKVLNFISYGIRSEKEIHDRLEKYLSKYHISQADLEKVRTDVYEKLELSGYLDDLNFAFTYVKSAADSRKPVSKRKLVQFLTKKGVNREIIAKALESLPDEFSMNNALKDAEKKLRLMGEIDKFSKKRKLMDFLYRKGYDSSTISSVVDTLL